MTSGSRPRGGALVYLDDALVYQAIEADEEVGYVIYYETEWDDESQRWVRIFDPQSNTNITRRRDGRVRICGFEHSADLAIASAAYHQGLEDGRTRRANWGGALYVYQFDLREHYDLGYRAALRGI